MQCCARLTEDEAKGGVTMRQFEYRVVDTGRDIESQLNELGAEGWQVVGVTTKKQLFIAPPQDYLDARATARSRKGGLAS
jgi:hypothetical protein